MKNLIIILSLFLFSCGARKVDKRETLEEIKTESKDVVKTDLTIDSNTKIDTKIFTDETTKEEIEETVISPIDGNKPAIYGKDTLNNASLTKRKIKRNKDLKESNNTILSNDTKTTDKTTKTSENKTDANKSESSKVSDRDQYSFLPWCGWIIIASAIFIFIFFWYRKAKKAKEVIEAVDEVV